MNERNPTEEKRQVRDSVVAFTSSGDTLKISWPSWASNFVLQQSVDLSPTSWVAAPQPAMLNVSNMQYEVTLNPLFVLQNPHLNFRLKQQ